MSEQGVFCPLCGRTCSVKTRTHRFDPGTGEPIQAEHEVRCPKASWFRIWNAVGRLELDHLKHRFVTAPDVSAEQAVREALSRQEQEWEAMLAEQGVARQRREEAEGRTVRLLVEKRVPDTNPYSDI